MKRSLTRYDRMLAPGTDRCQCKACGLYFNSSYAFGMHRYGPFAPIDKPDTRKCLDVHQLRRRGWVELESGHWATRAKSAAALERRKPDPAPDTDPKK